MNTSREAQEPAPVPRMSRQDRMSYAGQVRGARKALGLTQQELSTRAGISRNTVANIEDGTVVPQVNILWRVMGALDLRPQANREWPVEIEGWLRVLAPVIERIPAERRERVMLEALAILADAARGE